jgi:N-acetylglucosamine-6-phosphate deacetylase
MPQLHHRDPAIIGLLGAGGLYSTREVGETSSPLSFPSTPLRPTSPSRVIEYLERKISALSAATARMTETSSVTPQSEASGSGGSEDATIRQKTRHANAGITEALGDLLTSPRTRVPRSPLENLPSMNPGLQRKGMPPVSPGDTYARPYYGLIVDGIHSHPNSVRVSVSSYSIYGLFTL